MLMHMIMNDDLYRLLTWMSPSFPVGAYSFSHGLECAVETRHVTDGTTTLGWIRDLVLIGDGQADLVFLAAAWDATQDREQLRSVHELALAFQPSMEIRLESTAQGSAFMRTMASAWPCAAIDMLADLADGAVCYPVAVGVAARGHGVGKEAAALAYAHAFVANLVSAAVRLIPLGQTDGQKIVSELHDAAATAAVTACATPLESVSSSCMLADIAAMQHEVQYTRLFRS